MNKPITKRLSQAALYEQLAEECAELGKAAQKKARILRGENPTPVTNEQADADIREEYTDVTQCATILGLKVDTDQMSDKLNRWHKRLDKHEEEQANRCLEFITNGKVSAVFENGEFAKIILNP